MDVFVVDFSGDRKLYHLWGDNGRFNVEACRNSNPLPVVSIAAVTSWGRPRLDVFLIGGDGVQLYHFWQDRASTFGSESLGGQWDVKTHRQRRRGVPDDWIYLSLEEIVSCITTGRIIPRSEMSHLEAVGL